MAALEDLLGETWFLVGLFIFVLAVLSQAQRMWASARAGLGGGTRSPDFQDADRYMQSWTKALSKFGLEIGERTGELEGPTARGKLRGLAATIEMTLEATDGPTPDPESLNPASVHCRVETELELPFPHHAQTVRQFVRPEGYRRAESDDIDVGFELDGAELEVVRLGEDTRRALAGAVDEFHTLKIIGGTVRITDFVQPSRNTSLWTETFTEQLRTIRSRIRRYAAGPLDLELSLEDGAEATAHLEPVGTTGSSRCDLTVETDVADRWPDEVRLRDRDGSTPEVGDADLDDLFALTAPGGDATPPPVDDRLDEALRELAAVADEVRIDDGTLRASTTVGSREAPEKAVERLDALVGAVTEMRLALASKGE